MPISVEVSTDPYPCFPSLLISFLSVSYTDYSGHKRRQSLRTYSFIIGTKIFTSRVSNTTMSTPYFWLGILSVKYLPTLHSRTSRHESGLLGCSFSGQSFAWLNMLPRTLKQSWACVLSWAWQSPALLLECI